MRTPQSHTALGNPPSQSTLEKLRIPVQAKLAAAWTSFMFLYVYVDYLQLLQARRRRRHPEWPRLEVRRQLDVVDRHARVRGDPRPDGDAVHDAARPGEPRHEPRRGIALHPLLGVQRGRGDLGVGLLLRPLDRNRGADPGLHPALRLGLATPHRIAGDPGSEPRQRATPHAAAGLTSRPAPDQPSLAPPAGTVTCLSVRC